MLLIDPNNRIVYSGMPDDSKRYLLQTGKHTTTSPTPSTRPLSGKPITNPHTELEGCLIAW